MSKDTKKPTSPFSPPPISRAESSSEPPSAFRASSSSDQSDSSGRYHWSQVGTPADGGSGFKAPKRKYPGNVLAGYDLERVTTVKGSEELFLHLQYNVESGWDPDEDQDIFWNGLKKEIAKKYGFSLPGIMSRILNMSNIDGNNLLHSAAENINPIMLEFFANYATEDQVNAVNKNLKTPLHLAADHEVQDPAGKDIGEVNNIRRCVEILVRSKARVDRQDKEGNTPLHLALKAFNGDWACMLSLFDEQILDLENKERETPRQRLEANSETMDLSVNALTDLFLRYARGESKEQIEQEIKTISESKSKESQPAKVSSEVERHFMRLSADLRLSTGSSIKTPSTAGSSVAAAATSSPVPPSPYSVGSTPSATSAGKPKKPLSLDMSELTLTPAVQEFDLPKPKDSNLRPGNKPSPKSPEDIWGSVESPDKKGGGGRAF